MIIKYLLLMRQLTVLERAYVKKAVGWQRGHKERRSLTQPGELSAGKLTDINGKWL